MDTVFVSYSFSPEGKRLAEFVKNFARTYSLRPVDGESLGGGPLNQAIRERIEGADCLVALLTPERREVVDGKDVKMTPSTYVREELNHARAHDKQAIAIVAEGTELQAGLWDEYEYIDLANAQQDAAHLQNGGHVQNEGYLKLGRTLSRWRTGGGRVVQVLLAPPELAQRAGFADSGCRCEYKMTRLGQVLLDWTECPVVPEPGGYSAYLTGVKDDASLQIRMVIEGETWLSRTLPQALHAELHQRN